MEQKSVLIIDGDNSMAELERDYLEASNYIVDVSDSGKDGLEKSLQNDYSLILLDVTLPLIDGFEVCRSVRKDKEIPIVFVSDKKDDIYKIRAFGVGADDYIVKPFSPSELVARVHAHISRYERLTAHKKTEDSSISIGKICIEKNSRRVYLNGEEIVMTNKEFDLLLFLATNPNVVYSKSELLDTIWGFDAVGDTSTVTVHINRIREKIDDDSATPNYIETVWGAGYRFKV